jgi:exopolysaccharide biosynthesis polyprenyl glycosylphosphotransferase
VISPRTNGLFAIHRILQAILVMLLYWIVLFLFSLRVEPDNKIQIDRYWIYSLLGTAALVVQAISTPISKRNLIQTKASERLNNSLTQIGWIAAAIFLYLVATKDKNISRLFLFTWLFLSLGIIALTNQRLQFWIAPKIFKNNYRDDTILLYFGTSDIKFPTWLKQQEKFGFKLCGAISDLPLQEDLNHIPILGRIKDFNQIIDACNPTQLIIVNLPTNTLFNATLADYCDQRGIRTIVATNFDLAFNRSVSLFTDNGLQFLTFREEPLENPFNRITKRSLDLLVSLLVLVLVLPPAMLLVWIFQLIQSPGPLFFRQNRAGMRNEIFEIFKFRSMTVSNQDEAKQATKNDSRIYPAGFWFRKLSIDELPQFINVFRGEMSVVGPRPHLFEHNKQWAQITTRYHIRTFVKPGITGLAQVRGFRGEAKTQADLEGRVFSDIEYIESWTLGLDILIILRTILQVFLPPKTAY